MSSTDDAARPGAAAQPPTEPGGQRLVQLTARGSVVTFVGQLAKTAVYFAGTITLARLLSPADYGLYGMAASVTGFAGLFADLGINQAAIQRKEVSDEQLSGLFWLSQCVGVLFVLLGLGLSPVAAWFYGEAKVAHLVAALSLTFWLSAAGSQHAVILRRQMRFGRIVLVDALALLCAVAASIATAPWIGVWSLILQRVVHSGLTSLGYWLASGWAPRWLEHFPDLRSMLQFGAQLTGFRLLNYFARNLDNVLLGAVHGPHALGLYTRAYSLFMLPLSNINGPLSSAVIPGLSRAQADPAVFRQLFLGGLSVVAWLTLPASAMLIALADPLIPTVLGARWADVVPIFRLLSICAFGQAMANTMGWIYVARGEGASMLRWGVFSSAAVVASFVVGISWGAEGVALAYSITSVLLVPIGIHVALRDSPVRPADAYAVVTPAAVVSIVTGALAFLVCGWLGGIAGLAAGTAVFVAVAAFVLRTASAREAISSLKQRLLSK